MGMLKKGLKGGAKKKVGLGFSGSKGGKIAQGMAAKLKAKGWSG